MITATLDREGLRPEIVRTALSMFVREGIDNVRMDDVAAALSISKRTLYEIFSSKENLLLECLDLHTLNTQEAMEAELSRGKDVLSVALRYIDLILSEVSRSGNVLVSDLSKYPLFKEKMDSHIAGIHDNFKNFLETGIRQRVFRDDICVDVVCKAFVSISHFVSEERTQERTALDTLLDSTIIVMLRGIATADGLEKLNEYKLKYSNK